MPLEGPRRGRTAPLFRHGAEYAVAALLIVAAVHAGTHAALLVAAAGIVAGWAAIHAGPLGLAPLTGPAPHRAGLLVEAAALAGAPIVAGSLTNIAVSGPLLLAAVFLFQLATPRRRVPAPSRPGRPGSFPPPPPRGRAGLARVVGHWVGRAGTVVGQHASSAVPAGARRAGRLAGRHARRRTQA